MFDRVGTLWGFNNPNCLVGARIELSDHLAEWRAEARPGSPSWNAGGDGPAWSRKRQPYQAPSEPDQTRPLMRPDSPAVPYAELHCHTNFSFLDGASLPEQLAEEAARLGLEALAVTDHDGLYGVVRFAEAARAVGLPTVFGAEITLGTATSNEGLGRQVLSEDDTRQQIATGLVPDHHAPDPHGDHLLVLADGPTGYARLARALSLGHLAGEKSAPNSRCSTLRCNERSRWVRQVVAKCRAVGTGRQVLRSG